MLKSESFRKPFPHENKKTVEKRCKNLSPPGLHAPDFPCVLSNRSVRAELARTEKDVGHMYLRRSTGKFFHSFKVIEPGDVHDGHLRPFCLVSNFISIDS